jgi:hypothetical protein
MKANKALKRLAKIEGLISDVVERYSPAAPQMREALRDAQSAVARAREAVSPQASSGKRKEPVAKRSKPPAKAAVKKAVPAAKTMEAGA